jgi:hypothetical protein
MNYNIILSLFTNKIIIALITAGIFIAGFSYKLGLNHGFIPKEQLCNEEITWLNQCHNDLIDMQKDNLESLTECKASCHLDVCKPICTRQVSDAINSYKKLMHEFKCGSQQ